MVNVLTTRNIKFPAKACTLLRRGSIITHEQMMNRVGDEILVNDVTMAIARRINRFTDIDVCFKNGTVFHIHNCDENGLIDAYIAMDDIDTDKDQITIEEINCDDHPVVMHDDIVEEKIEEVPEVPSFMKVEDEIDLSVNEDKSNEEIMDDNDAPVINNITEEEETVDNNIIDNNQHISRNPHPNNKNKKHRH